MEDSRVEVYVLSVRLFGGIRLLARVMMIGTVSCHKGLHAEDRLIRLFGYVCVNGWMDG